LNDLIETSPENFAKANSADAPPQQWKCRVPHIDLRRLYAVFIAPSLKHR
jgi:hypothetical protein